jgi:hypothetical protein
MKVSGVTVPREKALDFSGSNSLPKTGSLHPMAIEVGCFLVTKKRSLSRDFPAGGQIASVPLPGERNLITTVTLPTLRAFATLRRWENLNSSFVFCKAVAYCFLSLAFFSCILEHLGVWNLLVGN